MIEFKADYYKSKTSPSQSVLVQFDGALLHIWNISTPFHRILSSDEFWLPISPGTQRCWVRLPHGSRIATDDIQALALLKSCCRCGLLPLGIRLRSARGLAALGLSALAAVLTSVLLACWLIS